MTKVARYECDRQDWRNSGSEIVYYCAILNCHLCTTVRYRGGDAVSLSILREYWLPISDLHWFAILAGCCRPILARYRGGYALPILVQYWLSTLDQYWQPILARYRQSVASAISDRYWQPISAQYRASIACYKGNDSQHRKYTLNFNKRLIWNTIE